MPRISYVDPDSVTEPDLARYLAEARAHGTPRLESQAIRAHVQRFLKTLGLRHGELGRDNLVGLAPDAAAALSGTAGNVSAVTPHAIA